MSTETQVPHSPQKIAGLRRELDDALSAWNGPGAERRSWAQAELDACLAENQAAGDPLHVAAQALATMSAEGTVVDRLDAIVNVLAALVEAQDVALTSEVAAKRARADRERVKLDRLEAGRRAGAFQQNGTGTTADTLPPGARLATPQDIARYQESRGVPVIGPNH